MNIRKPGQNGEDKGSAPENTGTGKAAPVHMYRVSLLILFFMMGSVFGSWASRIPDIKRALSLSDGALGLALFAAPTGEFAAVAVAALLIKRWGSQAVIRARPRPVASLSRRGPLPVRLREQHLQHRPERPGR